MLAACCHQQVLVGSDVGSPEVGIREIGHEGELAFGHTEPFSRDLYLASRVHQDPADAAVRAQRFEQALLGWGGQVMAEHEVRDPMASRADRQAERRPQMLTVREHDVESIELPHRCCDVKQRATDAAFLHGHR